MAPKGSSGKGKSSRHRSHKHRKEEEEQLQQSDSSDVEAVVRSKKSSKSSSSKHRDSEKDDKRSKRRHSGDSNRASKKSKAETVVAGPEPPTPLLVDYAGVDDESGHSKNRKGKSYSESAKLKTAEPADIDYKTSHNKTTVQNATLESKENLRTERLKDSADYKKEKKVKKEKEKEKNQQSAKGSNEWKDEETRKSEGEELENDKRRARDEGDRRKDHKSSNRKERQKESKHKEDRSGRDHHGDKVELLDYKANRSPSTSMKTTEKNRYDSEGDHKYSCEREVRIRKDNNDYGKRSKDQRYDEEVRRGNDRYYRDDDDYYYSDDDRRHRRKTEKSHRDDDLQRSYKDDEYRYRGKSHRDIDSHRREEKESEHRHRDVHEHRHKESKDEKRETSSRSRRASSSKPADSRSRDGDCRFPHDERKDYTHGRSFLDSDYRERSRSFDDDEYRNRHKSYKDERYYKDEDERSFYRGLKDHGDEKERHGAPDDIRSERSRKGPSSSRSSVRPEDASGRLDRTPVHRRTDEFAKGPGDPWSWNRGQFPQLPPHYAGPFPGSRHFSTSMYGRAMELAYPSNRFMGPGAEDGYPHWYGVPSPAVMDDATACWDRSRDSWSREDYYSHLSVESLHMSRPEEPWPSGFEEKEQDACNVGKPPPDRPSAKKTRISVQMRQLLSRLSVSEDLAGPDAYGRYINFMENEQIEVPSLEKSAAIAATDVSEPDDDLIFEADPEAEALLRKPDVIDAILPPLPTHVFEDALKAYRKPQEENRLRKSLVGSYILPAGCHSQTVIHPDNSTETPIKGCTTDTELNVEVKENCCSHLGDSSAVDLQRKHQDLEQTRSDSNGTDTIDRIVGSKVSGVTNSNGTDTIESNQLPDSNGIAADFEEESLRQVHEAAVTLQDGAENEQPAEGMSRLPPDEHKHHGKSN